LYCTPFFPSWKEEIFKFVKNFSDDFQRKYRKMPKTAEERRCRSAEKPLPQGKSRHHRQIPAQPQLRPADAEEGEQPAEEQLHANKNAGQNGELPAQGAQKIHGGTQQHPAQKAPQQPPPDHRRGQSRNPRFRPGSV
jgi:hypothetical protein